MAKLTILKEGEATLRKTCRPVTEITKRTKTLLDDMLETMRHADGVGLAAARLLVAVGVLGEFHKALGEGGGHDQGDDDQYDGDDLLDVHFHGFFPP